MKTFVYKARRRDGTFLSGRLEAVDACDARRMIVADGSFPSEIEELSTAEAGLRSVPLSALRSFLASLAVLLESGAVLSSALRSTASDTEDARMRAVTTDLAETVIAGESFSRALGRHPMVFDALSVSFAVTGERSGTLPKNLRAAAELIERRIELRASLASMCVYPATVAAVGILTVTVLMMFIVPKMTSVYADLGKELPLVTRAVLACSGFLGKTWFFLLFFAGGCVAVFGGVFRRRLLRALDDARYLFGPTRDLAVKTNIAFFSAAVASLLDTGTTLSSALRLVCGSQQDERFKKALSEVIDGISGGRRFSDALKDCGYFPSGFVNAVSVGEGSGTLSNVLVSYAAEMQHEMRRAVKTVMTLLEPAVIVAVGLFVGFIVIAMLLPIFDIDIAF